jgi:hypothetical protein
MQEKLEIDSENRVTIFGESDPPKKEYYTCSFCGKSTSKESVIIKGDAGNICSKCVEVCQQLIMDDLLPSPQKNFLKVHGRVVKNSDDVHCPHCGEYWVKVERVRCGECKKHFFLEH